MASIRTMFCAGGSSILSAGMSSELFVARMS